MLLAYNPEAAGDKRSRRLDGLMDKTGVERQIFCQSFYFWRNNSAGAVRNTYQISGR